MQAISQMALTETLLQQWFSIRETKQSGGRGCSVLGALHTTTKIMTLRTTRHHKNYVNQLQSSFSISCYLRMQCCTVFNIVKKLSAIQVATTKRYPSQSKGYITI